MGRHGVAGRGVLSRLCRSCPRGAGRGESKLSDAAVSGAGVRGREGGLSDVTQVLWVHPHTILPAPFRLEEMYRAVQQKSCKLLGTTPHITVHSHLCALLETQVQHPMSSLRDDKLSLVCSFDFGVSSRWI